MEMRVFVVPKVNFMNNGCLVSNVQASNGSFQHNDALTEQECEPCQGCNLSTVDGSTLFGGSCLCWDQFLVTKLLGFPLWEMIAPSLVCGQL